jgi:hypothetical protein
MLYAVPLEMFQYHFAVQCEFAMATIKKWQPHDRKFNAIVRNLLTEHRH